MNKKIREDVTCSSSESEIVNSDSEEDISVTRKAKEKQYSHDVQAQEIPVESAMENSSDSSSSSLESDSEDGLDKILVGQAKEFSDNEVQSYSTHASFLPSQIDRKIQKRIWKNKYIEFASLLPHHINQEQDNTSIFGFQVNKRGGNSNINIVPSASKQIFTI